MPANPPRVRLLVTADDLGYSCARNTAIYRCHTEGIVTNASLLVNGLAGLRPAPCTDVSSALCHSPSSPSSPSPSSFPPTTLSLGLHLNLTEGNPVAANESPKLAPNGTFLGKPAIFDALDNDVDTLIPDHEIEREIEAQFDRFRSLVGHDPCYVDGHNHIHVHPRVLHPLLRAMAARHVRCIRLPHHRGPLEELSPFLQRIAALAREAREAIGSFTTSTSTSPVITTDHFLGLNLMGAQLTLEALKTQLSAILRASSSSSTSTLTVELMTHPGHPTPPEQVNAAGCGLGPDDFSQSQDRVHERNVLCDPTLRQWLGEQGIAVMSWQQLASQRET